MLQKNLRRKMKKFILFLTSFLSITSLLNAQNIMYGFEIGGSFTNLDYDESYDFWNPEFTNSINVMIFLEYKFSESFLQQIGIRYVQQGSHIKYEDYHDFGNHFVHVKGSHDLKQNYISIPLRAIYSFGGQSIFVLAGPEFAFLISSKYDHNQESPDPETNTYSEDITSDLKRLNISLNVGLGYSFQLVNQKFYILTQYSHGLTSNAKEDKWGVDWKTREISINLGYFFPI